MSISSVFMDFSLVLYATSRFKIDKYLSTRVMRRELKKRGVEHVKVVYSREEPNRDGTEEKGENGKPIPASISCVPPAWQA